MLTPSLPFVLCETEHLNPGSMPCRAHAAALRHPATVVASRRRRTPGAQVLVGPFAGDDHPTGMNPGSLYSNLI
jgi:hypothetical protein